MSSLVISSNSAFHKYTKRHGYLRETHAKLPFQENRIKRVTKQSFDLFNRIHHEGSNRKKIQQQEMEEKRYTWQQERKEDQERFSKFNGTAMAICRGQGSFGKVFYVWVDDEFAKSSHIPEECVMKVSKSISYSIDIQLPYPSKQNKIIYARPVKAVSPLITFQRPIPQKDPEVIMPHVFRPKDMDYIHIPSILKRRIGEVQNMNEGNYLEEKAFRILKANKIPFIPQFYGAFIKDGHHCILMEHINHGNLKKISRSQERDYIYLCALVIFMKQLFIFARLLENIGFSHCDLKPENLFFFRNKDGEWDLMVIDYNLVFRFKDDMLFRAPVQTFLYRAVEIILGSPAGPNIDLWSIGCIIFEAYTGKELFHFPHGIKDDTQDQATLLAQMIALKGKIPTKLLRLGIHTQKFYLIDKQGRIGTNKFRPFPSCKSIQERMLEEAMRRGDDPNLVRPIADFIDNYCISYERPSIREAEAIFEKTVEKLFKEQLSKESFCK